MMGLMCRYGSDRLNFQSVDKFVSRAVSTLDWCEMIEKFVWKEDAFFFLRKHNLLYSPENILF